MILASGTTVQINQIKHDRVGDRYTGVVIADDGDHLVLQAAWLHENDLGVARIEPGDVATEHYWRSRYFSIWEVRGPAGLRGWYCNVARPAVLAGGTVRSRYLELDVWISADGATHVLLDEDEFAASPLIARHPGLAAEARRAARYLSELTPQRLKGAVGDRTDRGRRRQASPPSSSMTTEVVAAIDTRTRQLVDAPAALDESDLNAPTRLPAWTRLAIACHAHRAGVHARCRR